MIKLDKIKVKINNFKNIEIQSLSQVGAALHSFHHIFKMSANKSLRGKATLRHKGITYKP